MSQKKPEFDDLVSEALSNARKDREIAEEAYDNMKDALKAEDSNDVNINMTIGDRPLRVLEQMSRANSQIVKLAEIKEKEQAKKQDNKQQPYDLSELKEAAKEEGIDEEDLKVRVEEGGKNVKSSKS